MYIHTPANLVLFLNFQIAELQPLTSDSGENGNKGAISSISIKFSLHSWRHALHLGNTETVSCSGK